MSEKSFEELTDAELDALDKREWTEAEITAAMSMAMEAHDMEAVVALLHRLALIAPDKAQLILDFITLAEATARAADDPRAAVAGTSEGGSE